MALRGVRRFSTQALKIVDELLTMESEPVKIAKLESLKMAWTAESENKEARKDKEALWKDKEALLTGWLTEARKDKEATRKDKEANTRVYEIALAAKQESCTAVNLELLRTRGVLDTRGLFEYLQDKAIALHPTTENLKGSEVTWVKVLSANPALKECLRQHLGRAANLATHLVTTYQTLSQRVHAGKDLFHHQGRIVFESDCLTPQQCDILVCLGKAVGVPCAPAARRHIAILAPTPAPAAESAEP